jgi:hypothetical protein
MVSATCNHLNSKVNSKIAPTVSWQEPPDPLKDSQKLLLPAHPHSLKEASKRVQVVKEWTG